MGTLYVVGTPIGNLEDLTFRAARILGQAALIAAEDTRVTRRLLTHLGLRTPLVAYHAHNQRARLPELLAALETGDVALVSDAGMPGISDPGDQLISRAAAAGFRVEVVPGPSAVTAALALAGLPGDAFLFLGFLPRRRKERLARLEEVRSWPLTLVLFEAPHRLQETLRDILAVLGDRQLAVARELTKVYEEVFRATVAQAIDHFSAPRGEFVLVIQGAPAGTPTPDRAVPDLDLARQQLAQLRAAGQPAREAVASVAGALGLPKKTVYRLWLEAGRPQPG